MIHNTNCKRGDAKAPKHFHPHHNRGGGGMRLTKENLHICKHALGREAKRRAR